MTSILTIPDKIQQYERLLRPFAYNLTHSPEEAEDLIQDTFCRALMNQDKFTEGTNIKAWLFTIMRNIFINNYRKKYRNIQIKDSGEDLYLIDNRSTTVRNTSDGVFLREYIREAMVGISEDFTGSFMMYFNGFSYIEIAEKLNLPLGTVKSRIFFARKEIQANLKKMGITNSVFYN
jgi:RNA polymerase sigma-70 factor (ECF subfamily)